MLHKLEQFHPEIISLLEEAGRCLLRYRPQGGGSPSLTVRPKSDQTLVSEADLASNKLLTEGLSNLFPEIPVQSEEGGGAMSSAFTGYWLLDPLDGTANFLEGSEDFAILLAYLDQEHSPLAGWMFFPARSQLFWGIGRRAGLRGPGQDCLGLSSAERVGSGKLYLRWPEVEDSPLLEDLRNRESLHSGEAFYHFLFGRLDGLIFNSSRLGPWDLAAPTAIVRALGGTVRSFDGACGRSPSARASPAGAIVKIVERLLRRQRLAAASLHAARAPVPWFAPLARCQPLRSSRANLRAGNACSAAWRPASTRPSHCEKSSKGNREVLGAIRKSH